MNNYRLSASVEPPFSCIGLVFSRAVKQGPLRVFDGLASRYLPALFPCLDPTLGFVRDVPEPIGFVSRLDDVAVVGQPVEQVRGHLCVAEHTGPLGEDPRVCVDDLISQNSRRELRQACPEHVEGLRAKGSSLLGQDQLVTPAHPDSLNRRRHSLSLAGSRPRQSRVRPENASVWHARPGQGQVRQTFYARFRVPAPVRCP